MKNNILLLSFLFNLSAFAQYANIYDQPVPRNAPPKQANLDAKQNEDCTYEKGKVSAKCCTSILSKSEIGNNANLQRHSANGNYSKAKIITDLMKHSQGLELYSETQVEDYSLASDKIVAQQRPKSLPISDITLISETGWKRSESGSYRGPTACYIVKFNPSIRNKITCSSFDYSHNFVMSCSALHCNDPRGTVFSRGSVYEALATNEVCEQLTYFKSKGRKSSSQEEINRVLNIGQKLPVKIIDEPPAQSQNTDHK